MYIFRLGLTKGKTIEFPVTPLRVLDSHWIL